MTAPSRDSGRSDLTFEEMVRLDIYYAENWSIRLDLEILLPHGKGKVVRRGLKVDQRLTVKP